jgi:stringent starvation protein B
MGPVDTEGRAMMNAPAVGARVRIYGAFAGVCATVAIPVGSEIEVIARHDGYAVACDWDNGERTIESVFNLSDPV